MAEQAVPTTSAASTHTDVTADTAARSAPGSNTSAPADAGSTPRPLADSGSDPRSPAGPGAGAPTGPGVRPAPAAAPAVPVDVAHVEEIIGVQEEIFCARQQESRRFALRAGHALAGGVTSSWQITRPQPVWLSHGKGSKIFDVDGNEYV